MFSNNNQTTATRGLARPVVSPNDYPFQAPRHRKSRDTFPAIDPHWSRMCSTEATYTNNFMHITSGRQGTFEMFIIWSQITSQLLHWHEGQLNSLTFGQESLKIMCCNSKKYNRFLILPSFFRHRQISQGSSQITIGTLTSSIIKSQSSGSCLLISFIT